MQYPQNREALIQHLQLHPFVLAQHPLEAQCGPRVYADYNEAGIFFYKLSGERTLAPLAKHDECPAHIKVEYQPSHFTITMTDDGGKEHPIHYYYINHDGLTNSLRAVRDQGKKLVELALESSDTRIREEAEKLGQEILRSYRILPPIGIPMAPLNHSWPIRGQKLEER